MDAAHIEGADMLELNGFYNMDCMEGMKQFPDKYFELAIVDPPYGKDIANMNMGVGKSSRCSKIQNRKWKPSDWDKEVPQQCYFDELFRISKNQIIFGANYFSDKIPPSQYFAIWDKGEGMYDRSFSECEYAWVRDGGTRIFKYPPFQHERIHPTQKPVALYEWLLQHYAKSGYKILDTHVGSASSLIACYEMGFDYIGFELDPDYFKAASERLDAAKAQQSLFRQGA
jgi:site-specific DNA-methyltransferase (adenine-specific)